MGTHFGKGSELNAINEELKQLNNIASDPYVFGGVHDKREFFKRKKMAEDAKASLTPPPINGDSERRRLEARRDLLGSFIASEVPEIKKPAKLTRQEQWDKPAGAVGRHQAYERAIQRFNVDDTGKPVLNPQYAAAHEYKDVCRRLAEEEGEWNQDVANLGVLERDHRDKSSFSDYARMNFAPGAGVSQERWDATFRDVPAATPVTVDKRTKAGREPLAPEKRCTAVKSNGDPCPARRQAGSDQCYFHNKKKVVVPEV